MFNADDTVHMHRALALAERGLFNTTPNPRVGCVLVRQGAVIGEGYTQPAGQHHAEVQALIDARNQGNDPAGSTAYVTLEPCSHFGRTPPCADILIEAKVARVVAAMEDPNPKVLGRGLQTMRAAGIDVRCGLLEKEARELNIGFVSRMTRKRPWVRLKIAASLDGKTALCNGTSQWITSPLARDDGHRWRARACAILTGIGTVRQDDPLLTVRAFAVQRQPLRILIDSALAVPIEARMLDDGNALVVTATPSGQHAEKVRALSERGVEIIRQPDSQGKVDLAALLTTLAERGINELHVEAGTKLNGALLRDGCVDELLIYLAPTVLGSALGMFELGPFTELAHGQSFDFHQVDRIGPDLRILARRKDSPLTTDR